MRSWLFNQAVRMVRLGLWLMGQTAGWDTGALVFMMNPDQPCPVRMTLGDRLITSVWDDVLGLDDVDWARFEDQMGHGADAV